MSTASQLAIGIDLGGTHIKAALVERDTGTLVQTCSLPPPPFFDKIVALGVGFAGTLLNLAHEL